jgi:hypothetical protein
MEPVGIIVIAATLVFVCLAVLCAAVGAIVWSCERTRFLGPFITLVPSLALIGASGGSWTLALITVWAVGDSTPAPGIAWLGGLGLGRVSGALLGWRLSKRKQGVAR